MLVTLYRVETKVPNDRGEYIGPWSSGAIYQYDKVAADRPALHPSPGEEFTNYLNSELRKRHWCCATQTIEKLLEWFPSADGRKEMEDAGMVCRKITIDSVHVAHANMQSLFNAREVIERVEYEKPLSEIHKEYA